MSENPKAFISYAWESEELKGWVKVIATELRTLGVNVKLDQWELVPGDQTPHFMEESVRDNDFVLIICTPTYKTKSEKRIGGVGYEGDIMSAEVLQKSNHRKFIPILKYGNNQISIPSWLSGKYFIDLSNEENYEKNFDDLITTLLNKREVAPKLGIIKNISNREENIISNEEIDVIRIKGIIVNEITEPRSDGTSGSALYSIPFELNKVPDQDWINIFISTFDNPPHYTSMHRPGIASVYGNKIILTGTTIQEVQNYHKETLILAVNNANSSYKEIIIRKKEKEEQERLAREKRKRDIEDISNQINFD